MFTKEMYVVARLLQYIVEIILSVLNRSHYLDAKNQAHAKEVLTIDEADFSKTLNYTEDKFKFGRFAGFVQLSGFLAFLWFGGFGYVESYASLLAPSVGGGPIITGLVFFALLGLISTITSLPFEYYSVFVTEEKHGFNKQTKKIFFVDKLKGLLIGVVLGGVLLGGLLWVMERLGDNWWIWAWLFLSSFSIIMAWAYPTFISPLFNKFTPLEDGELKDGVFALAKKINFKTSGIHLMDASIRSSHGNAYFTGLFGEKRIVLFDTLVKKMSPKEVVAVLAHELGHFKLNHVRWMLIRGLSFTGVFLYLLSLLLDNESMYASFGFSGVSNYAALVVFPSWFGLVEFVIGPISSFLSRKNEFAADNFAREHADSKDLVSALLNLRQSNHAMPISHPLYSSFYYSHPPLSERIDALRSK
ncbi:M48 family metallopeptidase [bacterium]|nr:M48 family metallopeptidase [bacterium]